MPHTISYILSTDLKPSPLPTYSLVHFPSPFALATCAPSPSLAAPSLTAPSIVLPDCSTLAACAPSPLSPLPQPYSLTALPSLPARLLPLSPLPRPCSLTVLPSPPVYCLPLSPLPRPHFSTVSQPPSLVHQLFSLPSSCRLLHVFSLTHCHLPHALSLSCCSLNGMPHPLPAHSFSFLCVLALMLAHLLSCSPVFSLARPFSLILLVASPCLLSSLPCPVRSKRLPLAVRAICTLSNIRI